MHGLESLDFKETRPASTFISQMILVKSVAEEMKMGLLLGHFCNGKRERLKGLCKARDEPLWGSRRCKSRKVACHSMKTLAFLLSFLVFFL